MSVNQCTFIGNLGADPEIRSMQNGDRVANFRIAVSEKWKDKDGNQKESTEWVSVVVWGGLTSIVEKYLRKGSKVYIQGKMKTRKWQDKSGADKYSTEIVLQGFGGVLQMLDSAGGSRSEGSGQGYSAARQEPSGYGAGAGPNSGGSLDDEIPFSPHVL